MGGNGVNIDLIIITTTASKYAYYIHIYGLSIFQKEIRPPPDDDDDVVVVAAVIR